MSASLERLRELARAADAAGEAAEAARLRAILANYEAPPRGPVMDYASARYDGAALSANGGAFAKGPYA